jgi:hypothetical protein
MEWPICRSPSVHLPIIRSLAVRNASVKTYESRLIYVRADGHTEFVPPRPPAERIPLASSLLRWRPWRTFFALRSGRLWRHHYFRTGCDTRARADVARSRSPRLLLLSGPCSAKRAADATHAACPSACERFAGRRTTCGGLWRAPMADALLSLSAGPLRE